MPTTTQRPSRARKPAAAPAYSPAAVRLIEQIQAEAREKLLQELSTKDAIIVLHGFDPESRRLGGDGTYISIRDFKGNCLSLYRHHTEPDSWRSYAHMEGHWHPARWYGNQTLVDANGNLWERSFNVHVCDDFGNLVEVAQ